MNIFWFSLQNHWFTYNETMTVESVTQAVSNLALQFGEEDADPGAMVWSWGGSGEVLWVPPTSLLAWSDLPAPSSCSLVRLASRCFLEESMRRDLSCKFSLLNPDQLWEETELPLDILMT